MNILNRYQLYHKRILKPIKYLYKKKTFALTRINHESIADNTHASLSFQNFNNMYGLRISNILVCGDGDLSYSSSIAPLWVDINLTATVLESYEDHNKVYKKSHQNYEAITSQQQHKVLFGIDATNLTSYFQSNYFDRVQFNFPHWRGKQNTKHNRILISEFLRSAEKVISSHGEIHLALCDGQVF